MPKASNTRSELSCLNETMYALPMAKARGLVAFQSKKLVAAGDTFRVGSRTRGWLQGSSFAGTLVCGFVAYGCGSCPTETYTSYDQEVLEVDPNLDADFRHDGSTVEVVVGELTFNFNQAFWHGDAGGRLADKSFVLVTTSRETDFDSCDFEVAGGYFQNIETLDSDTRVFTVFVDGALAQAACELDFEEARQSWIDDGKEVPEGLGDWAMETEFPTISFTIRVEENDEEVEQECK